MVSNAAEAATGKGVVPFFPTSNKARFQFLTLSVTSLVKSRKPSFLNLTQTQKE
jgi:hypothetical protein